jgi:glycosyltransferase involved in cell wall biosynthesis
MKADPRIAVVIPTLNEASAIVRVIGELPRAMVREIIVADGGSMDETCAKAQAAGARVLDAGRGYGRACALGAAAADPACDVIVFLDGDGADRGDLLGELTAPIMAGTHDFVLASRTKGEREPGAMLWHQLLAGRMAGWVIGARYGVVYSDMCAFRAIRRDALNRLGLTEMGYGWNIEMQLRAAALGLRILERPLPYRRRAGGTSKVAGSLSGTLRAIVAILRTVARVLARPAP